MCYEDEVQGEGRQGEEAVEQEFHGRMENERMEWSQGRTPPHRDAGELAIEIEGRATALLGGADASKGGTARAASRRAAQSGAPGRAERARRSRSRPPAGRGRSGRSATTATLQG